MLSKTVAAGASLHDEIVAAGAPPLRGDAARFLRVQRDIDAVLDSGEAEQAVRALEEGWGRLVGAAFRDADQYESLLARLPQDDPARATMGLLELVGSARREALHTRAIASLLDPRPAGGAARLRAFLMAVLPPIGLPIPTDVDLQSGTILVETSYPMAVGSKTLRPRPDIRIEVGSVVVVVENKVDAVDRDKQLSSYTEAARDHHDTADLVLVYLTPAGESPSRDDSRVWRRLSYTELTIRWRAVMADDEHDGRRWTDASRAYMSTLARGICGWRVGGDVTRADRSRMIPYLRAAIGEHHE